MVRLASTMAMRHTCRYMRIFVVHFIVKYMLENNSKLPIYGCVWLQDEPTLRVPPYTFHLQSIWYVPPDRGAFVLKLSVTLLLPLSMAFQPVWSACIFSLPVLIIGMVIFIPYSHYRAWRFSYHMPHCKGLRSQANLCKLKVYLYECL